MSEGNKLCMSCMSEVPSDAKECPTCGYNGSQKNPELYLPIGFRLAGRYVVGKLSDTSGDTATYIGYDVQDNKKVQIREFVLEKTCKRNEATHALIPDSGTELHFKTCLMDFCDLYRNLAKLSQVDSLIHTLNFFEANHTAYAVLEIFEGITLRDFLNYNGGLVKLEQAIMLLEPIFDAVDSIHSVNLIHRGISPDTILINRSGEIKLGGFATTSVRTMGDEVENALISGYSAPEQYSETGWQSTATDVYALSATLYRCITGIDPQESGQRKNFDNVAPIENIVDNIPDNVASAINLAMLINARERLQTGLSFRKVLFGEVKPEEVAPMSELHRQPQNDIESNEVTDNVGYNKMFSLWKLLSIISACLLAVTFIVFIVSSAVHNNKKSVSEDEEATVSQTVLTVPNYVGENIDGVVLDVINFNFEIETTYKAGSKEGDIVVQSPGANSTAKKGDTIKIFVHKETIIKMIDFTGFTKENAEMRLHDLGIPKTNYKFVSEETSSEIPKLVFKQSVEEGIEFNANVDELILTIATAKVDEE